MLCIHIFVCIAHTPFKTLNTNMCIDLLTELGVYTLLTFGYIINPLAWCVSLFNCVSLRHFVYVYVCVFRGSNKKIEEPNEQSGKSKTGEMYKLSFVWYPLLLESHHSLRMLFFFLFMWRLHSYLISENGREKKSLIRFFFLVFFG